MHEPERLGVVETFRVSLQGADRVTNAERVSWDLPPGASQAPLFLALCGGTGLYHDRRRW